MTPWYIKAKDLYGDQLLYLSKLADSALYAERDEDCFGFLWNTLSFYKEDDFLAYDSAEVDFEMAVKLTKELSELPDEDKRLIIQLNVNIETVSYTHLTLPTNREV